MDKVFGPPAAPLLNFLEDKGHIQLREKEGVHFSFPPLSALTVTLLGGVWMGSGHHHMDVNLRGGGSGKQIKAKWERDNSIIETLSEMQG